MKLFVLEDDESWQFIYRETLANQFNVEFFSTIEEFDETRKAETEPYVLLADLRIGERSFVEYLRHNSQLPKLAKIMVLSALDEVKILEECFNMGVSDYLTKPINVQELLVKTKRLVDLATNKNPFGIAVDPVAHRISIGGHEVHLTSREFQIMNYLIEKGEPGASKDYLLQAIWRQTSVSSNTIEVHICNIRKKIEPLGFDIISRPPNTFYLASTKKEQVS
jgi:DNA-binding response OmpR family regulator